MASADNAFHNFSYSLSSPSLATSPIKFSHSDFDKLDEENSVKKNSCLLSFGQNLGQNVRNIIVEDCDLWWNARVKKHSAG